jgi:transposase
VRTSSLNRWIKQFLTAGLAGLIRPEHNHRYTLQTKRSAVKAYLSGTLSGQAILNRYQIRSLSQLHQWIVRYNSGQLSVAYATRKRARKVDRKVTFEEKRQITQWTIDHEDNRGRHKGKTPTNEVERLRQEVRQLKAKAKEREVQIAFAKKLVEIHNREVERPDDIKRFRK